MAENILSAEVTVVSIGDKVQLEGLKLEDRRYAIAVRQATSLFGAGQENPTRNIKSLLGKQLVLVKVRVKRDGRTTREENALLLDDFRELILAFAERKNIVAKHLIRVLIGISLEQLFADAFDVELTKSDRQSIANRILDTPSPWKKMYEPEFCKKAFSMFGSSFYWQFCYSWMTQEEQCKVNRVNPLVNGKRDARIHQFLDTDTRKRLTPYVAEMVVLIDVANSKEEFNNLYARRYGANQLNLL